MAASAPSTSFTLDDDEDETFSIRSNPKEAEIARSHNRHLSSDLPSHCDSLADALLLMKINAHAVAEAEQRLQVGISTRLRGQLTKMYGSNLNLPCSAWLPTILASFWMQGLQQQAKSLAISQLILEQEAMIKSLESAGNIWGREFHAQFACIRTNILHTFSPHALLQVMC